MYDWDKSTALLAAQSPWWEPGTPSGYHMMNKMAPGGGTITAALAERLTAIVKSTSPS